MVGVPTRHGWCPHQPSVAELAQVLSVGQGNGLTWANNTNSLPFHGRKITTYANAIGAATFNKQMHVKRQNSFLS